MLHLPTLNACLNGSVVVLLLVGLALIRRGRRVGHARTMIAAAILSAAFLAGYLTYHFAVVPEVGHTPFRRGGVLRVGYYGMLISHVALAAVNLPMILVTLWRAWRGEWERHRRLARWTWPIWMYVSVTGVLVYFALYWWNPGEAVALGR